MGDDKGNKGDIGFSGISSLLPDDPPDAASQQPAPAAHPDGSQSTAVPPASGATGSIQSKSPASVSQPKQSVSQPRSGGGGAVWAWIGGIAAVIFAIWVVSQSGTQSSGQSDYQSPVVQGDSSAQPSTPTQNDQANATTATAQQSAVPALQRPPVGSGNIFSVGEIRYCLVLKQWVEGAQPVVDTYSQDQVDRFNKMVDDYNSRCHDFRYQTGDLEKAKRDIAPYTQRFQALSRQWVRYGETPTTDAQRPVAQAATRTMVGDAQRALNTLGYNVGKPDGVVGGKTRTAIKLFQRQNALTVDGLISAELVARLQAAAASHPRQSQEQSWEALTTAEAQSPVAAAVHSDRGAAATPKFVHAHELGDCSPTYPLEAARLGQSGTVELAVRVGSDGGVTAVQIVSSSDSSALDSAAVSAMEQCRFSPAMRNGEPVVDKLELPVSFKWGG